VLFTNNWIVDNLRLKLKQFGLTNAQYNILRILAGSDRPITTSDIRSRMIEKMSDISRLIDRMQKKGWVTKKTRPTDRRLLDISISQKGREVLTQVANLDQPIHSFISSLSDQEAKKLNELLDKLRS